MCVTCYDANKTRLSSSGPSERPLESTYVSSEGQHLSSGHFFTRESPRFRPTSRTRLRWISSDAAIPIRQRHREPFASAQAPTTCGYRRYRFAPVLALSSAHSRQPSDVAVRPSCAWKRNERDRPLSKPHSDVPRSNCPPDKYCADV